MPSGVEIVGIDFAHLRGYSTATLALAPRLLLVGPNNSGKSSLFALLRWVFEAELGAVRGDRALRDDELRTLLPSRDSRGKARRLTLLVRVEDGRRHVRFNCEDGIARIRFTFSGGRCRLTISRPGRAITPTENDAVALLEEVRAAYEFVWVPAGMGSTGSEVAEQFRRRFAATLQKNLRVTPQTGASVQYRRIRGIRQTAGKLAAEYATALVKSLGQVTGISPATLTAEDSLDMEAIADLLSKSVRLRITTGDHDAWGVDPGSVGSGLQSLILIGLHRSREFPDRHLILAVEEPEAHLHPSLQHAVAKQLLAAREGQTVLVSTHSAAIVSQATYGQTVLVKRQQFYPPAEASDEARASINSMLMQGRAAEAFFADNVLLVEGPGDYQFFEALRQRVVSQLDQPDVERAFVLEVGSNTRFGPWLRLFRSYGDESNRPIQWTVLADGDSVGPITQGLVNSGQSVPLQVRNALNDLGSTPWNDLQLRTERARRATDELRQSGLRSSILPVDLEWALLSNASEGLLQDLRNSISAPDAERVSLAQYLGSKVGTGKGTDTRKDPWIRAEIGARAHWSDISESVRAVLTDWLAGLVTPATLRRL